MDKLVNILYLKKLRTSEYAFFKDSLLNETLTLDYSLLYRLSVNHHHYELADLFQTIDFYDVNNDKNIIYSLISCIIFGNLYAVKYYFLNGFILSQNAYNELIIEFKDEQLWEYDQVTLEYIKQQFRASKLKRLFNSI